MHGQQLIDAIVREPDVDGHWLVYADWLCERGDPRGELINLGMAAETDETRARIRELERDEDRLLSPRLAEQAHYWRFEWRRGFIHRAILIGAADDPAGVEAVDALFADPHAGLLEGLSLGLRHDVALFDAAMASPRPSLRQMRISGAVTVGECLDAMAPGLDHLVVVQSTVTRIAAYGVGADGRFHHLPDTRTSDELGGLSSLAHRNLRSLATCSAACRALCSGDVSLPRLEELGWHSSRPADDPIFAPGSILHTPPPRLRKLGLWQATGTTVDALAACPVASQLRRLDIYTVTLDALERLCGGGFTGLERLAIESGPAPELSSVDLDALRARLVAALPTTELAFRWGAFAEQYGPRRPQPTYDAESRGPDGRISALGAWASKQPT